MELKMNLYKSYRIVKEKPRWVIIDEDGKIINNNPSSHELRNVSLEFGQRGKIRNKRIITNNYIVKKRNRKVCIDNIANIDNFGPNLQTTIKQVNYKELKIVRKELELLEEKYGDRWMNMKWDLTI